MFHRHSRSGQIIATSHDLTPNGGLVREIPLFQGNLGWWNIISWPARWFKQIATNHSASWSGTDVLHSEVPVWRAHPLCFCEASQKIMSTPPAYVKLLPQWSRPFLCFLYLILGQAEAPKFAGKKTQEEHDENNMMKMMNIE